MKLTSTDYIKAERKGIYSTTLRQRISAYNWDKEKAITTPPRNYEDHGDFPKIAEQNGITKQQYYDRYRIGWSKEKASTIPVRKRL